jgi:hypothetical protein
MFAKSEGEFVMVTMLEKKLGFGKMASEGAIYDGG